MDMFLPTLNPEEKELQQANYHGGEKKNNTERVVTELSQKCMRPRCFHRLILSILQKTDDTNAILTVQEHKERRKNPLILF